MFLFLDNYIKVKKLGLENNQRKWKSERTRKSEKNESQRRLPKRGGEKRDGWKGMETEGGIEETVGSGCLR